MEAVRRYLKLSDITLKELAKRVFHEVQKDSCTVYAAAMAYYLLFALFPFFLFLATLIGYLPFPELPGVILDNMQRVLPAEASRLLEDNVKSLFTNKKGGLLSLGFIMAIWTSSSALTSIMEVMNRLYDVEEGRPFWKVRLTAIGLIAVISVMLILALTLVVFGPKIGRLVTQYTDLGTLFQTVWNVALVPMILLMLVLSIALIYYFTPDVEQDWRWITPGAVFAIPIWILASLAFSFYVNNFGSYDRTYGSIGAVIILLLWLYITVFIILVGAEINAVVEHASPEGKEPGEKKPE